MYYEKDRRKPSGIQKIVTAGLPTRIIGVSEPRRAGAIELTAIYLRDQLGESYRRKNV